MYKVMRVPIKAERGVQEISMPRGTVILALATAPSGVSVLLHVFASPLLPYEPHRFEVADQYAQLDGDTTREFVGYLELGDKSLYFFRIT